MQRLHTLTLISCSLVCTVLGAAQEQPLEPPAATWRVITKESPPFAFRAGEDGQWHGIGIELAEEIADRLGVQLSISAATTVDEMLTAVQQGRADAAIAAITVTESREQHVDFTHPYFSTGLGVAMRTSGGGSLHGLGEVFASSRFLPFLILALVGLVPVGTIFWLLERRRHPDFRDVRTRTALGTGVWWSTSILLGNKGVAPRSTTGKVLAAIGMLASILFVSLLTGALASILTLSQLETRVRDVGDLRYMDTLAVAGTSGAEFLEGRHIPARLTSDPPAGLREVEAGHADALIHDAPILRYLVQEQFHSSLRVLDRTFDAQDYAIALALGSPWRKPVNRALLEVRSSDEWEAIRMRYLGR